MNTLHGHLHHVELWVTDLGEAEASIGWLLTALGYEAWQRWSAGVSFRLGATYIVLEQNEAIRGPYDRKRAGLNHLAFHVETSAQVDELVEESAHHGWRLLYADRHPHAAGQDRYVGYLQNGDGFKAELVAAHIAAPAESA